MITITNSVHAWNLLAGKHNPDQEEFFVLALNSAKKVLGCEMIFRGTVDKTLIHPRDIFRYALLKNSASMIIAHNHPSGEMLPSKEDIKMTTRLLKCAETLQLPINDHIIFTDKEYYSFADEGMLR